MLKRLQTPLVLLAIAGLLGAGVYGFESRKVSLQPGAQGETGQPIVAVPARDIEALTIKTIALTIVLDRIPSTGPPSASPTAAWMMRSPKPEGQASETSVAFLTNLLVSKGDRLTQVLGTRKAEFGLDQPLATIEVRLPNQQMQTIVLGKLNFDRTGLYAAVNPPVDPNTAFPVLLVSPSFESAVTRPIGEWRSGELPHTDRLGGTVWASQFIGNSL